MNTFTAGRTQGSMLLSLAITTVLMLISTAIISTVIASATSTRATLDRAESRSDLQSAMSWVQRRWPIIPVVTKGVDTPTGCFEKSFTNGGGGTSSSVYASVGQPRGDWEFCYRVNQLPGEEKFQGVDLTGKVKYSGKTRYYKAHLTGTPADYGVANGFGYYLQPLDHEYGSDWGFISYGGSLTAGGAGATFQTYSSDTGAITPGVPMVSSSYELQTANEGLTRQITGAATGGNFTGGTCNGTGCAGTTLTNVSWDTDAGQYASVPTTCSKNQADWPDWRASLASPPGVLNLSGPECFSTMIFDRTTSVTGTATVTVSGDVTVADGVKVNVPNSRPDARKLQISGPTSGGINRGFLSVGKNASIAARYARIYAGCTLEPGSTWYGSLGCSNYLDAAGANLRYQRELFDNYRNFSNSSFNNDYTQPRRISVFPNDGNFPAFKEVSKTEAGY